MKKIRSDAEVIAEAKLRIRQLTERNISPTVEMLAREMRIRRPRLSQLLKQARIPTERSGVSEERFKKRLHLQPRIDLVAFHGAGYVHQDSHRCKNQLSQSLILAFGFAYRGLPKFRPQSESNFKQSVMAPSVVSSDKMRAVRFESLLPNLIQKLDNPHEARICIDDFTSAVSRSLEPLIRSNYNIFLILHGAGEGKQLLPEVYKKLPPGSEVMEWENDPNQVLASLSSLREFSCLGAGFFPLLASTLRRMDHLLRSKEPISIFKISWTDDDIECALSPRLKISDSLCRKGALLGAPESKLGEMARYKSTPMTRKILPVDALYTDGVEIDSQLNNNHVHLVTPLPLPQKLLFAADQDWDSKKHIIEKRIMTFQGNEVETLVAWLPDLRDDLLRSVDLSKLDHLHKELVDCQRKEAEKLHGGHQECWELINPEGQLIQGLEQMAPISNKTHRRFTLGLVLTAYDSDILIGWLLNKHSKARCRNHQQEWHDLIRKTLHSPANRKRILAMTRLKETLELESAFDSFFSHVQNTGSRIIRFVIEQAASNFSRGLLTFAKKLDVGAQNWQDFEIAREEIPQLEQVLIPYWPVGAIRVDYLLKFAAFQVRKRWFALHDQSSNPWISGKNYTFDDSLHYFDSDEIFSNRAFEQRFNEWRPEGAD